MVEPNNKSLTTELPKGQLAILDYLRHGTDVFTAVDVDAQNEPQYQALVFLSQTNLFEVCRIYKVTRLLTDNCELEYEIQAATGNYIKSGVVRDATVPNWPDSWVAAGRVQEYWLPITKARLTSSGLEAKKLILSGKGSHIPRKVLWDVGNNIHPPKFGIHSFRDNRAVGGDNAVAAADIQSVLNADSADDGGETPPLPDPPKKRSRKEWLGQALLLRKEDPDRKKVSIAIEVGVDPGQLSPSRCPELAALEEMLSGDTTGGHVTRDADTGLSDVEAIDPADDKADRGQSIPDSKFYKEYCHGCDEPMRVSKDLVNTSPLCEACA